MSGSGAWGTRIERRTGGGVPFLGYVPRRHHLTGLLADGSRWRERTAIVQGARCLSYADVLGASARLAETLVTRGLRPGDRLLLLSGNSVEWILTFWAGVRAGAVVVLGNTWWSADELAHA